MPFLKLAAALLVALASAAAAEAPLPTLRIEPATGGSVFYIKNTYTQPVTAYLIELVDYPGSYYSLWEDVMTSEAIPAGGERRTPISNMTVGAVPDYVKMTGAIFADGSTAGIPEKVTLLIERRRAALQAVRELIGRVGKAAAKDALIADLRQWSDSMPPPTRANARSQAAINQGVSKMMISNARNHLAAEPIEKVLADLRNLERFLAVTKPAL
jgi:hypothetical protein